MKTYMRMLFILVVVLIVITSCNKDSSTTPIIPTIPGTMTVDINGVPDTFNTRATAVQGSGIFYFNQTYGIHVIGFNDKGGVDSTDVSFWIVGGAPISVGTYDQSTPDYVDFFYVENADSTSYQQNNGPNDTIMVRITSIDSTLTHRIQGTFSGMGGNIPSSYSSAPATTDTFTKGKFDVPLSNY